MLQAWFWHWFWGLYFCSWGVSSSVINGFPGHKAECCRIQARIFVAGSGVVTLLYELHGSCQVDINGIIYWGLWQKRCNWCVCDQGLEHSELEGSAASEQQFSSFSIYFSHSHVYLIYPQLHPVPTTRDLDNVTKPRFLGGGEGCAGAAVFLLNQAVSVLILLMLCQRIFQNGFM